MSLSSLESLEIPQGRLGMGGSFWLDAHVKAISIIYINLRVKIESKVELKIMNKKDNIDGNNHLDSHEIIFKKIQNNKKVTHTRQSQSIINR